MNYFTIFSISSDAPRGPWFVNIDIHEQVAGKILEPARWSRTVNHQFQSHNEAKGFIRALVQSIQSGEIQLENING